MGNRTAKFVSAIVGSIIAGAPLAAVSQNAPNAASTANVAAECLASPKGATPQGQHWYYRLERATKRKCWYLRAEGGKASQTAQATTDAAEADSTAPQAVQNARAEYAPQTSAAPGTPNMTVPAPAATSAPPVAQQPPSGITGSIAQQPAVTAPLPEVSTAAAAPAPQPAPVAATAPPRAKPAKPAPAPAAAGSTADKPIGSLQMLLLVIGGALALAGILASVIYRFAGGRVQAADRRGHWDDWTPEDYAGSRAPWLGATAAVAPRAQPRRPVDFDETRPPQQTTQLAAFTNEIGRIAAQSASIRNKATELDKADIFDGDFEIAAAPPRLAAKDTHDEKPVARDEVDRDEDVQIEDAVDVDVITAMLERLAKQGPRLPQPSPEAGPANLARNQRGQSAARA